MPLSIALTARKSSAFFEYDQFLEIGVVETWSCCFALKFWRAVFEFQVCLSIHLGTRANADYKFQFHPELTN